VLDEVARRLPAHVRLVRRPSERPIAVTVDPDPIASALRQLVEGALSGVADEESGRVEVRWFAASAPAGDAGPLAEPGRGATPGWAVLEIADDGAIPAAALFADRTTGPAAGMHPARLLSRELGLVTAAALVRAHRGDVEVLENEPRGTRIRLRLPLAASIAPLPSGSGTAEEPPRS
jgi:hypothetical protein